MNVREKTEQILIDTNIFCERTVRSEEVRLHLRKPVMIGLFGGSVGGAVALGAIVRSITRSLVEVVE